MPRIELDNAGEQMPREGGVPDRSAPRKSGPVLPVRGRGSEHNPTGRFESESFQPDPEYLDDVVRERANEAGVDGEAQVGKESSKPVVSLPQLTPRTVETQVLPDRTRTILQRNDVPDIHFRWTINPYRGCEHGCSYCYARPGHEYLGMSCGLDFETRILAKHNAPELLEHELRKPSWKGETIVMSGVTDPYQPIERELRITRRILEVCERFKQSVSLITKNALILRDLDILGRMTQHGLVHAAISITTLNNGLASRMEPRASAPRERLRAVRDLTRAGVPVSVMVAPVIPGLTDHEMPAILRAAKAAGAHSAHWILLRLPYQVKAVFLDWLAKHEALAAGKVEQRIRNTRGGRLYDSRAFVRQRGEGPAAEQIGAVFNVFARKYGLDKPRLRLTTAAFQRTEQEMTLIRARSEKRDGFPGQLGLWSV